jgi:hypothetical protein
MAELKLMSMPMSAAMSLGPDQDGKAVDQREYRSMIGSLLYLTVTRSEIQFIVCLCAHLSISKTHSSLGFGILLLLHWILLSFLMLMLRAVELIVKAILGLIIFLDLLSFADLLKNNL